MSRPWSRRISTCGCSAQPLMTDACHSNAQQMVCWGWHPCPSSDPVVPWRLGVWCLPALSTLARPWGEAAKPRCGIRELGHFPSPSRLNCLGSPTQTKTVALTVRILNWPCYLFNDLIGQTTHCAYKLCKLVHVLNTNLDPAPNGQRSTDIFRPGPWEIRF